MYCLKMADPQRENIFSPLSKAVCGVKGRALCTEHKGADRPEARLPGLFSQEFRVGRKRVGGKEKIKSLFYEHRKEICPGLNSKQGLAGSRPGVKTLECEDVRQCLVCPLPKTRVTPATDGSAVGGTADWSPNLPPLDVSSQAPETTGGGNDHKGRNTRDLQ